MRNQGKLIMLMLLSVFTVFLSNNLQAQVQTAKYVSMSPVTNAYYEYLPQGYNPSGTQTYPLILFLHGSGELGNGSSSTLPRVLANGVPRVINQGQFPTSFTVNGVTSKFIVISPQFSIKPSPTQLTVVLAYIQSHYKVDPNRVYITGLSLGGGVVWNLAAAFPSKVAAIVPVCGASSPTPANGERIANAKIGVWAFHNQTDPTVPVKRTNDWIAAINAANPQVVPKKTIWAGGGHDAWSKAYDPSYREDGKNMYEYMLQYSKGSVPSAPPPNVAPTVSAGSDRAVTMPFGLLQLSASASDPDGTIASTTWTKVSGPTTFTFNALNILNPIITLLVQGSYTFRVTVT
ncbi:MAG: hypothetical protein EOO05_21755, partial [Chitinophagaceae bacterium]